MAIYNKLGNRVRKAYYISGEVSKAYNLSGDVVFKKDPDANVDQSTGIDIGYKLISNKTDNQYTLRQRADFNSGHSCQSMCYNSDDGNYYKFDASTTVKIYDASMNQIGTVTLPSSAGHNNDACFYNGKFYFPESDIFYETSLHIWDVDSNTVTKVYVDGIQHPSNGNARKIVALCNVPESVGKLYLICTDNGSDEMIHLEDDKMSVYLYDMASNKATLLSEYVWDCVYSQGCVAYKNILYVTCNTQTTGSASNYLGVTLKAISLDTMELFDELIISGAFEPEGMDLFYTEDGIELLMGIASGSMSKAVSFTPPWV